MVEETSETPVETSAVEGAESKPEQPETPKGDGVPTEVKAALRKANKEAETLRLRLKEFEDRDKSELDKAVERATTAEKAAADHELAAIRLAVAFEKGLTPAQAKRLVGSSRDDLEADADEVLRDFPVGPVPRFPSDASQGARATPTVLEAIATATAAKDWKLVGQLKAQQLSELSNKT